MPKSERDEALSALTARVFQAMIEELVMDTALQAHHEVARGRTVCSVCKTRCGSIHTPSDAAAAASRGGTPSSAASADVPLAKAHANGTGTSTPTSQKVDGNLLFECVSCSRQIASNRYAPHLSSCMGLGNARRGAARTNTKAKAPSEAGGSASPMSEAGYVSDDGKANGKGKSKAKGKKGADEGDFSLKRKRPGSPQISPNKKAKKGKPSGSPVSRVKADPDHLGIPKSAHYSPSTNSNSQSKVPSKLRDSSTASFLDRASESSSSRESSPDAALVATPASSFSSQSPARPLAAAVHAKPSGTARSRPQAMGTGPPKRPSPPSRPPLVHVPDYHIEIDHANETGSSTDTDSE